MELLSAWLVSGTVAHAVLILSVIIALGCFVGKIRVLTVRVGVVGVLFVGLAFGNFQFQIDPQIMDFAREFGLILFVYSIGMQVGPGFLNAFKQNGASLIGFAAAIVLLGAGITFLVMKYAGVPALATLGLYAGGVTNTPSLGAVQQMLKDVPDLTIEMSKLPGLGYAMAYPFGMIGTILALLALRPLLRIDVGKEEERYLAEQAERRSSITTKNLEVTNPNLEGQLLRDVPALAGSGVVISRVRQGEILAVASMDTRLHLGDVLLAVGPAERLKSLQMVVGRETQVDLREAPSEISAQRVTVTETSSVGRSLEELNLTHRYGVVLTRVTRGEVELPAHASLRLQFGDRVLVVGEPKAIERASQELGNSIASLNHPPILPVFIGLALGVALGTLPIPIPGMAVPLRLGLAGGPLIVAMLLARWGKVGPVVWYMPVTASFMLREIGIALFLACVGIKAGDHFVATLLDGGWIWMLWAALITVVPLLVCGVVARMACKMNYLTICGYLAGSMTDPPALAFATSLSRTEAPAIAYAMVYPVVMLLRVLTAQLLVVLALR